MRRQGTGRVTTKRTFSLNVFKGSQLGQFGRKTGLPLKQGVKRDAYGLDDVDNFWRDSLEGAPSDQQAEGAGEPPAPISHEAPAAAPVAEPVAEENPFLRANKLMRTPGPGVPRPPVVRASPPRSAPLFTSAHAWPWPTSHAARPPPSSQTQVIEEEQGAGASPLAPTQLALGAEEEPASAHVEAAAEVEAPPTNPFKRRGAVMRTPRRPAVEPLAARSLEDDGHAQGQGQGQDEPTQPTQPAQEPAEVEMAEAEAQVEATQPAELEVLPPMFTPTPAPTPGLCALSPKP